VIDLLAQITSVQRDDVLLGIGDDAAVLDVEAGGTLVVATDSLVEGTHFFSDTPASSVGHRCLAVNLSDLAAMGVRPRWANLALALPELERDWLEGFAEGFARLARLHAVSLVGGDTVRGNLSATVTLQGLADAGETVRRSGAQVGDGIWVSGCVGDAAAGLQLLDVQSDDFNAAEQYLVKRFWYPEPRVDLGFGLRAFATAMIDVSDGLNVDLGRLLDASGCGARADVAELPLSAELQSVLEFDAVVTAALSGGEDYELCFTVPKEQEQRLRALSEQVDVPVTRIGAVVGGDVLHWSCDGEDFKVSSPDFEHFS
ncbi:MAG: thiamine-phosphate kinase, partial [Gammaproteobacteria bacterium]